MIYLTLRQLDIFIYNHCTREWDIIDSQFEYLNIAEIRELLKGEIIEKPSGARYKIDEKKKEERHDTIQLGRSAKFDLTKEEIKEMESGKWIKRRPHE